MLKKSIITKFLSFLLLGLVIDVTIYNMSDLRKAKTFLYFKGIEKGVDPKYIEFQKIIKTENLKQVSTFNKLPEKYLILIEKFKSLIFMF